VYNRLYKVHYTLDDGDDEKEDEKKMKKKNCRNQLMVLVIFLQAK